MTRLLNQPICIDNGTGILKAGFASEDVPRCLLPSVVGRVKYTRCMAGAVPDDTFIGSKAHEMRGLLRLTYPMEHGMVQSWDDMERIWAFVYGESLQVSAEEHPALLTEAPLNPKRNRDRLAQVFFESFNVPALQVSLQAVLSLYASGRTTGIVVDSGDGVTHTVPVYEGFAITPSIQRMDLAGRDVTEYLQLLLRKAGYSLTTSAEKDVVRQMKEQCCYLVKDFAAEQREWSTFRQPLEEYRLPDGQIVRLGSERFRAPEILFQPELVGLEMPGVHRLVQQSLFRADLDLRSSLASNIILSGGSTVTTGFGDRLLNEMRTLMPSGTHIKIFAPPERKYSTWIGASILASLSSFRNLWVSAEEYAEDPNILHRKGMQ